MWTSHNILNEPNSLISLPVLFSLPGRPIAFLHLTYSVSPKTQFTLCIFSYPLLDHILMPFTSLYRLPKDAEKSSIAAFMTLYYKCWFTCLLLSIACKFLEGVDNVIYFYVLAERLAHIYPSIEHFFGWMNKLWHALANCLFTCLSLSAI